MKLTKCYLFRTRSRLHIRLAISYETIASGVEESVGIIVVLARDSIHGNADTVKIKT
jgi:hypothetical protein